MPWKALPGLSNGYACKCEEFPGSLEIEMKFEIEELKLLPLCTTLENTRKMCLESPYITPQDTGYTAEKYSSFYFIFFLRTWTW